MHISPDEIIYWQWKFVSINATLVFTWLVMLLLGIASWLVTRHLSIETKLSKWQNVLEILVLNLQEQIEETSGQTTNRYLPFIGCWEG